MATYEHFLPIKAAGTPRFPQLTPQAAKSAEKKLNCINLGVFISLTTCTGHCVSSGQDPDCVYEAALLLLHEAEQPLPFSPEAFQGWKAFYPAPVPILASCKSISRVL